MRKDDIKKALSYISKQQPPRPGLVAQSGDPLHPKHWVLPEYEKHTHDDLFRDLAQWHNDIPQNTQQFIGSVEDYYNRTGKISPRQREVLEKIHSQIEKKRNAKNKGPEQTDYSKLSNEDLQSNLTALSRLGSGGWSGGGGSSLDISRRAQARAPIQQVHEEIERRKKEGSWDVEAPKIERPKIHDSPVSEIKLPKEKVKKPVAGKKPPRPGLEYDYDRKQYVRPGLVGSKTAPPTPQELETTKKKYNKMQTHEFADMSEKLNHLKDHELDAFEAEAKKRGEWLASPSGTDPHLKGVWSSILTKIDTEKQHRNDEIYTRKPPKEKFGDPTDYYSDRQGRYKRGFGD